MGNSNYDSLAKKLMQNGILPNNNEVSDIEENFFKTESMGSGIESPFDEEKIEIPKALQKTKRLNKSDFEMVSDKDEILVDSSFKTIRRFIDFKQNLASKGALSAVENFLFAFFPKLYKAKLARDAMVKLKELNIDTNKLLDKTIPYGEGEIRYQNLIKYLSYANEIQTKIKNKIN